MSANQEQEWTLVASKNKRRQTKKEEAKPDLNNNEEDCIPELKPVSCSPLPHSLVCSLCGLNFYSPQKYFQHAQDDAQHLKQTWKMWRLPENIYQHFVVVDFVSGYKPSLGELIIEKIQESATKGSIHYGAAIFKGRSVMVLLLASDAAEKILSCPESITCHLPSESQVTFSKRQDPKKPLVNKGKPYPKDRIEGRHIAWSLEEYSDPGTQLTQLVSMTQVQDLDTRLNICRGIERIFNKHFAPCEVTPFGSSFSGLGFRACDLDMHIKFSPEGFPNCPLNKEMEKGNCGDQASLVEEAARILKSKGSHLVGWVQAISTARVPIVKLIHRQTGIPCDIMFKSKLGVSNTHFLGQIVAAETRIREYMFGLRSWAMFHRITGGGSCHKVTNYSFGLLMIFYLQTAGILPPIKALQQGLTEDEVLIINGWNCGYKSDLASLLEPYLQANNSSAVDLIKGFLGFYSSFDFEANVICPFLGMAIPRDHFQVGGLEWEMPLYAERTMAGEPVLDIKSWLCIQDPFELNRNVTGSLKSSIFMKRCIEGWAMFVEGNGSLIQFLNLKNT